MAFSLSIQDWISCETFLSRGWLDLSKNMIFGKITLFFDLVRRFVLLVLSSYSWECWVDGARFTSCWKSALGS